MNDPNPPAHYTPATWERITAAATAVAFVGLVMFLAVRNTPFADPNIVVLVRIVLSLAVAILGATIPGFLHVGFTGLGFSIRAGGALALFVITYFGSPQVLTSLRDPNQFVFGPDQFPSEAIIEHWPSNDELALPPETKPSAVTFHVKNATHDKLKLFVYDFAIRHGRQERSFAAHTYWQAWPFPPDGFFHPFSDFSTSNGWYGFAVGQFAPDGNSIQTQYLETKNIFYSANPTMTVTHSPDVPHKYQATFGEREEEE